MAALFCCVQNATVVACPAMLAGPPYVPSGGNRQRDIAPPDTRPSIHVEDKAGGSVNAGCSSGGHKRTASAAVGQAHHVDRKVPHRVAAAVLAWIVTLNSQELPAPIHDAAPAADVNPHDLPAPIQKPAADVNT